MSMFKNTGARIAAIGAGAILLGALVLGIGIYRWHWQSGAVYAASAVIPYPAIIVGGEPVYLRQYLSERAALNRYWEYQRENRGVFAAIPDASEIREQLVRKLVAEKIISQYARKSGINATEQEVYAEWERIRGGEEGASGVSAFVSAAYGWSDEEFIELVLAPFLLRQKVAAAVRTQQGADEEAERRRAWALYELAQEQGADFEALAREHSEDARTASRGGDMGYFGRGSLEPQLEQVIFSMKPGEISEPAASSLGWHIILLEDLLHDEREVPVSARARHILIRGFDFGEWIERQKSERAVYRLVR